MHEGVLEHDGKVRRFIADTCDRTIALFIEVEAKKLYLYQKGA